MDHSVARVYVADAPYFIDKPYDYYIPEDLRGTVAKGGFVSVPFGNSNRKQLALVGELISVSEITNLKPVLGTVCEDIALTDELIDLCKFLAERTFCTVGDAMRAVVPVPSVAKIKIYYEIEREMSDGETAKLPPKSAAAYLYLKNFGRTSAEKIRRDLGDGADASLTKLCASGIVKKESIFTDTPKNKYTETVSLAVGFDEANEILENNTVRGKKQRELIEILRDFGTFTITELTERYGISKQSISTIEEKKIVKVTREDKYRDPYENAQAPEPDYSPLSDEQSRAKDELAALYKSGQAKAALLHGVTGSGKTRVIKAMTDVALEDGKRVIILVPEISLTPQMVAIFRSYYGNRICVLHSKLSAGERYDAWRKMKSGDIDVCIGTRSAIFAPFDNIGLIVIDEEQEHTYKSDMNPKYHARDVAAFRCAHHKCLMISASATPSLQSLYKVRTGAYSLVKLTSRYGNAKLPETVITDMREDARGGNVGAIGSRLRERLAAVLERGEQAILFVNRRGYNNYLSCPLCGEVLTCPKCSVSYTYHSLGSGGYLYCHYCGTKERVPQKCPSCGNEKLRHVGFGTQKVEHELEEMFPKATVLRMDADTTQNKFAYEKILSDFKSGKADILLGTQMVTKGHDFPNVTLVGVVSADSGMYISDYRANEQTFDLLTQVIGRAGRADKPGVALIQTYSPDHPVLRVAASQNYDDFCENEMALRKSLVFPPYCDIICITVSSKAENELHSASRTFDRRMKELLAGDFSDVMLTVFGPMEAPIYKINDTYRLRFVIKCKNNTRTRALFKALLCEFGRSFAGKIGFSIDVNPSGI